VLPRNVFEGVILVAVYQKPFLFCKNTDVVWLFLSNCCVILSGFPRGIEKVLNCAIGFQDIEKVLNWPKRT